jgi:hypothetical protein
MSRCIIHRWFYVSSTNGQYKLFSKELIKREDRFCRDCGKMQTKLSQFTKTQQRELLKVSRSCFTSDWITFTEGSVIDKITMKWLKINDNV